MKIILAILLFIGFHANATSYYVANLGNDSNDGLTPATAWKTIVKLNMTVTKGDSVFFKTGDSWNEKLIVPSSDLYFGSYGTKLRKPLITGFQSLTVLTDSSNIWSATASSSVDNLNTVLINGVIAAKGRYPNTGYLTFNSYSGDSSITGTLSETPNYEGAQVAVRSAHWILDVTNIHSQSGSTLNVYPKLTYTPKLGGNGYFIENSVKVLDTTNEWAYRNDTKTFYVYGLSAPDIQISTINTLVSIIHKDSVTFDGISFQGANFSVFNIKTCRNILIKNCDFNNNGNFVIISSRSPQMSVLNNTFNNTLSVGIYSPSSDSVIVSGNLIKNTGKLNGMAAKLGYYARMAGMFIQGKGARITNNTIDSTGYLPIYCISKNALVKNNFVSNFCFNADDGGGIYMVSNDPTSNDSNSIIRSNIVINGIGAPNGTTLSQPNGAAGIYLDNNSLFVTVDSNSVYNCQLDGININQSHDIVVTNNNIFVTNDSTYKVGSFGIAVFGHDLYTYNLTIKRNNIAMLSSVARLYIITRNVDALNGVDSNYYSYGNNEGPIFSYAKNSMRIDKWRSLTGNDVHTIFQPAFIAQTVAPIFVYNPTKADSTVALSGNYIDIRGKIYYGSIVIHPYKSATLYTYFSSTTKELKNTKVQK